MKHCRPRPLRLSGTPGHRAFGILPLEASLVALQQRLLPYSLVDPEPPEYVSDEFTDEWFRSGRLVVAGDGACTNQGTLLARAGCGAFFGPDHVLNFEFALEGPVQDSDHAELRALLRVARWTPCLTEYLCDNEALGVGFEKLWLGSAQPWADHGDLWTALRLVLDERGWDLLRVSFVKGHADAVDIAVGRATAKKARWNAEADRRAVAGAALYAVPTAAKDLFRRRVEVTKLMQHTLLNIHEARTHLWSQRQLLEEGHGSGPGDAPADPPGDPPQADTGQAPPGNEAPRRLQAQDVFARPQTALRRYCWERPDGGTRFALPPLPARIGAAPNTRDRHKNNPDHLFVEIRFWVH